MNQVEKPLYDKAEKCCVIACRMFSSTTDGDWGPFHEHIVQTAGDLMGLSDACINSIIENIKKFGD